MNAKLVTAVARSGARSRIRLVPLALVALAASFLCQTGVVSATSQVEPNELRQYQADFGVSEEAAERNLELQSRGAGIVEFLRHVLKENYAGVWFDNAQGTFVVPIAPGSDRQEVENGLDELGLRGAYRIKPVKHSWSQLEEAQGSLITALQRKKIPGQEVSALLDPRSNAVAVRYGKAMSPQATAEIEGIAAKGSVPIQVSQAERNHLAVGLMACTTSKPRACDKPLRGGVEIGPLVTLNGSETAFYYGTCTAGFKAIGNVFGNRYMLTAGHCFQGGADKYKWASSVTSGTIKEIGPVEEFKFGAAGDWGKIRANGSWWEEIPSWPSLVTHYWGNQTYPINYEAWPYLGEYLCFSGNKSGTSCGNVTNLSVAGLESEEGVKLPPLVEVQGLCTEKGDSGGPLFSYSSNTAIGMLTGGYEAPTCASSVNFFTEIVRATTDLGVTVGTRIGGVPSATTGGATSVGEAQATVTGSVNPNQVPTTYHFQYGKTTSYGSVLPVPDADAGHGGTLSVSTGLSGLSPGTTYHYRLVATSAAGVSVGQDREFKTLSPSPAAVNTGSAINVYARGSSGHLYQKACCFGPEGWTSWWDMGAPPGGQVLFGPAAVQTNGGVTNVYVVGQNGNVYQKACCFGAEGWTSWWDMSAPPGGSYSSVAAVNTGSAINVYVRSTNGHLYQKACCFGAEGWTAWWDMGAPPGQVLFGPAAVQTNGGVTNVYVVGQNGNVYQKACCFGAEGWTSWWDMSAPSGGSYSSVAAVNTGSAINVYVRSTNGHLYQKGCCFGAEGWTAWWDMGGPSGGQVYSGAAAVQTNAGKTNVYAFGLNGDVYQKACCFGEEGWSAWWDMGGTP